MGRCSLDAAHISLVKERKLWWKKKKKRKKKGRNADNSELPFGMKHPQTQPYSCSECALDPKVCKTGSFLPDPGEFAEFGSHPAPVAGWEVLAFLITKLFVCLRAV